MFFHLPLYGEGQEGPPDGFTLMGGAIRPVSRGSLRLSSADPDDALLLDPAYLQSDEDVAVLAAAVELCREIGRQPAPALRMREELYPGPAVRDGTELNAISGATPSPTTTRSGRARWGSTTLRSSGRQLTVRGVEGLRVADASVMPEVTSGNTHAPSVMIGERAADLVTVALRA